MKDLIIKSIVPMSIVLVIAYRVLRAWWKDPEDDRLKAVFELIDGVMPIDHDKMVSSVIKLNSLKEESKVSDVEKKLS